MLLIVDQFDEGHFREANNQRALWFPDPIVEWDKAWITIRQTEIYKKILDGIRN